LDHRRCHVTILPTRTPIAPTGPPVADESVAASKLSDQRRHQMVTLPDENRTDATGPSVAAEH
jgi:hypothetical protein